jgi:hypothetical protein
MATRRATPVQEEEIEDRRGDERSGLDSYPLDTLLIRSEPRAIADVIRRIEKNVIKLDPDFEREFTWEDGRQSRLVESVLMRIPLPVFYLAEDPDGSLIVVDGLQRLTTFRLFHQNKLRLTIKNPELDGKVFRDLSPKLQDRFEDGPLTFYLIDPQVPERVRLDIFERVNSGVALTRQQMRNALYNGPASRLLRELAQSTEFMDATGRSLSTERRRKAMSDREAVNRFVAHFSLGWRRYGSAKEGLGDFDDYLGSALRQLNTSSSKLRRARVAFLESMRMNTLVFGKYAFRKHTSAGGPRNALNLALFEVLSVGLARYPSGALLPTQAAALRRGFYKLLARDEFAKAISDATARPDNVHTRFRLTEEFLEQVLGAP